MDIDVAVEDDEYLYTGPQTLMIEFETFTRIELDFRMLKHLVSSLLKLDIARLPGYQLSLVNCKKSNKKRAIVAGYQKHRGDRR